MARSALMMVDIEIAIYVVIPTESICCKLFEGIGAGPLFSDWMKTNVYKGSTKAGDDPKHNCYQWTNPHLGNAALMKGDCWMTDDDGIPCEYRRVQMVRKMAWLESFVYI